jgi:hypothetical protein
MRLDPGLLGYRTIALLRLTTTATALEPTSIALAQHPEVAFVAPTTGSNRSRLPR